MRDDFIALDLLSTDGFSWSPHDKKAQKKKKRLFGLPRRKKHGKGKRGLTTLLAKVKEPRAKTSLQGWPVTLSWPDSDSSKEMH
jgi:hypothetical protein